MKASESERKLQLLKQYTELQAHDRGLWCDSRYASEAYMQKELRLIVHMIEESSCEEIIDRIVDLHERVNKL